MTTLATQVAKKSLNLPDETRRFGGSRLDLVTIDDITFGRASLMPGWRWSRDVRPLAGTESCQARHAQFVIHGRLRVRMDDGTEMEFSAGDAGIIPPGHDAWVVGNEPCVLIDFEGMKQYGRSGDPGLSEFELDSDRSDIY